MRVAVAGAGLMGAQIGCEYALGGHEVVLSARRADGIGPRAAAAFATVLEHGLATAEEVEAARERVAVAADLLAAGPFDLVVESVAEDAEAKREVLAPLVAAWPEAIVATNTSGLPVGDLGRAIGAPERTVGAHYMNPPLLMPLVELVHGAAAPEVVERVDGVLRALGKRPLHVRHDVPGFLWNRLQAAVVREALWLVEHGVADEATVDLAMRDGLARRWRHVGVFETVALGGPETFARIAANLFPELSTAARGDALAAVVPREPLDVLRARRDAGLAEALRDERDASG